MNDEQAILQVLNRINRALCEIDISVIADTSGPPTWDPSDPTQDQTKLAFDKATGTLYFWNGTAWQTFTGGIGSDTNEFNTDLAQINGDKTHNAAGLSMTINNQRNFTRNITQDGALYIIRNSFGGQEGYFEMAKNRLFLSASNGVAISSIFLDGGAGLGDTAGVYRIGDGVFNPIPPADPTKTTVVAIESNGVLYTKSIVNLQRDQLGINIDPGGVIPVGYKGRYVLPYDAIIVGWTVLEVSAVPVVSSIVIDVKKSTYASYSTVPVFTSIAGSEKPTIVNDVKGRLLSLSTWTAAAFGDVIEYTVESVTAAQKIILFVHTLRI